MSDLRGCDNSLYYFVGVGFHELPDIVFGNDRVFKHGGHFGKVFMEMRRNLDVTLN